MLYALKVMTYHSGEQKRKEKFLYREDSAIIISIDDPKTPPSTPSAPRGSSPKRVCDCFIFPCW